MKFASLEDKISHARSLSHNELPELPVDTVRELIEKRDQNTSSRPTP